MTAPATATAAGELPMLVETPRGSLAAIVATPATPANGLAVVQLGSAGWRASSGNRRAHVHLARRVVAQGFHAVRFSYRGIAESTGPAVDVVRLDQPFVDEAAAVAGWARANGLRPVLLGNCFGGRTALAHAAATTADIAAVVLLVPPVHDFEVARNIEARPPGVLARRITPKRVVAILRDPARRRALARTLRALTIVGRRSVSPGGGADPAWLSARFCHQLAQVTGRGIPVLVVYGDADGYGDDFEMALAGRLGRIVERAGPTLTRVTVPGRVHGLACVDTQAAMLDAVVSWLGTTLDPGRPR